MIQSDPNANGSSEEQAQAYAQTAQPGLEAALESCRTQLTSAQVEADEFRNRFLRAAAEVENARKQAERDAAARIVQERRRFLREFLEVADSLERTLSAPGDLPTLYEGVKLSLRQLQQVLSRAGTERMTIKPGDTFDPVYQEAVEVRSGEEPRDTVVDVVRSGYMHDGVVLRPAQVIVARGRQ
ncbi:MAG TPA: nucleotide exchange factor GrpE [Chloroflexia bacterium]|nr:nucleotide exchange factor GrpE [Chloroflexia bacterium]